MGFFDENSDDPFGMGIENFLNKFLGDGAVEYTSVDPQGRKKIVRRGKRNVLGKLFLNKVISEKRKYYIFDLSGKEKISAKIINSESKEKILQVKENEEILFDFPLEEGAKAEDFKYNFINGILEVDYKKWKI